MTVPPDATARNPLWLHSTSAAPPLAAHVLTAPLQFLQSHTFTAPSTPAVATYLPAEPGSTLTLQTGPTCASRRTAGSARFGVQRVRVPFWCPRWMTAVCASCAIVRHAPSFVRWSETSWPVEVSWYLRKPVLPCASGERRARRERTEDDDTYDAGEEPVVWQELEAGRLDVRF